LPLTENKFVQDMPGYLSVGHNWWWSSDKQPDWLVGTCMCVDVLEASQDQSRATKWQNAAMIDTNVEIRTP